SLSLCCALVVSVCCLLDVLLRVSVVFCFSAGRAPPYFPSFPTRRSSDLFSATATSSPANSSRREEWMRIREPALQFWPMDPHPRSEEHTSELQSRFDLVCRLLLEKKNT